MPQTLDEALKKIGANAPGEHVIEGFTHCDNTTAEFIDEDGDLGDGLNGYCLIFDSQEEATAAIHDDSIEDAAVVPVRVVVTIGARATVDLEA